MPSSTSSPVAAGCRLGWSKRNSRLCSTTRLGVNQEEFSVAIDDVFYPQLVDQEDNEMTKQELAEKLAEIYTNSGTIVTASLGIFTFAYGAYAVDVYSPTELIEAAHAINPKVKTRYNAELNAAFAMFRYFKKNQHCSTWQEKHLPKQMPFIPLQQGKHFRSTHLFLPQSARNRLSCLRAFRGRGRAVWCGNLRGAAVHATRAVRRRRTPRSTTSGSPATSR